MRQARQGPSQPGPWTMTIPAGQRRQGRGRGDLSIVEKRVLGPISASSGSAALRYSKANIRNDSSSGDTTRAPFGSQSPSIPHPTLAYPAGGGDTSTRAGRRVARWRILRVGWPRWASPLDENRGVWGERIRREKKTARGFVVKRRPETRFRRR